VSDTPERKKPHSQKRIRNLKYNVYLTAEEKAEAHQIAANKGLTLADLIRSTIFVGEGGAA
jgi:hypothetical protein